MPTINKPFLLKLLVVVLALAGLLAGAHTLQARRIPNALKRQSERCADADKNDAAIHYLRQYLEFEPDDADAMEKLANFLRLRDPSYRGYIDFVFMNEKESMFSPHPGPYRRRVAVSASVPDSVEQSLDHLASGVH